MRWPIPAGGTGRCARGPAGRPCGVASSRPSPRARAGLSRRSGEAAKPDRPSIAARCSRRVIPNPQPPIPNPQSPIPNPQSPYNIHPLPCEEYFQQPFSAFCFGSPPSRPNRLRPQRRRLKRRARAGAADEVRSQDSSHESCRSRRGHQPCDQASRCCLCGRPRIPPAASPSIRTSAPSPPAAAEQLPHRRQPPTRWRCAAGRRER